MKLFGLLKGKPKVLPDIGDAIKKATTVELPGDLREVVKASPLINKSSEEEYLAETERLADQVVSMADAWLRNSEALSVNTDENPEFLLLEEARDEIKRRKYTLLNTLTLEDRWSLTCRHPMWIMEYDLPIGGIVNARICDAFIGDHVGLECQLAPFDEKPLKTFFYVGGMILKVNTLAIHCLHKTHAEDPSIWEVLKFMELSKKGLDIDGEFTRRDLIRDKEHQWLFVGTRWDYLGTLLKLDFGRHIQERDYFVTIMNDQREQYSVPRF
jgi:hypothetical protein